MDVADRDKVLKIMGMLRSTTEPTVTQVALGRIEAIGAKYGMNAAEAMGVAVNAGLAATAPPPPPRQERRHYRPEADPFSRKVRGFADESNAMLRALDRIAEFEQDRDFPIFNSWEQSFIVDVAQRYDADYELSEKQTAIVLKIIGKAKRSGVKVG